MKRFLPLIAVVFLVSCTSNTIYKKPENLIPKDTMKLLLTDMYMATSAKYTKNKFSQKDVNYMALVYEKYKIDSIRFEESNFYYNTKIEVYSEILKDVKKELEKRRDTFDAELKRQDSIEGKNKKKENLNREIHYKSIEELELKTQE